MTDRPIEPIAEAVARIVRQKLERTKPSGLLGLRSGERAHNAKVIEQARIKAKEKANSEPDGKDEGAGAC